MRETKKYESGLLRETYYKITHESGLEVLVCPKKMSGTYAIFSTRFGGAVTEYCKNGERITLPLGCAHFLEHKMFDNEGRAGADDVFSSYGAYDNAYTSSERTAYLFSAAENFDECIRELLSFVTQPYFTEESVNKEIGIIAEEIRGCIDDPYDRCYLGLLDGMYFNDPVKNEICGTEESISHITPELLYKCCEDFYTPENMILTVCGDVTPEQVMNIVDECIHAKENSAEVHRIREYEPQKIKCAYTEKYMPVGKPLICIGIKDTDIPDDSYERMRKNEAVNILCNMLFSQSGEFYLDMLERGIISPGFDCGYSINKNTAYVMMSGECDDPPLLISEIKKYISSYFEKEFDISAFEREKRSAYASYVSDFDSTEDIAFALLSFADEDLDLFCYTELLSSVTPEYIKGFAKKVFDEDKISVSVILPADIGEEETEESEEIGS